MTIEIGTCARPGHLPQPKYRADIDGLRAIAILSVVGFHAFPNLIRGGFIGVDIFFVISGYLISTIIFSGLKNDSFSFAIFYCRRINRIFPALLILLVASFALGWFLLLPADYKQLGKHIMGGAGFVSNLLYWGESGYFDDATEAKPLLHLWSLGVEEQFYIIWPLLLWFAWRQELNLLRISVAIAVVSFALNIAQSTLYADWAAAFFSPLTRFWELLAGSVLAHIKLQNEAGHPGAERTLAGPFGNIAGHLAREGDERGNNLRSALGIGMLGAGMLVITRENAFPGWWALMPTLGTVLVISAGPQAWLNRKLLSHPLLVWFGLISFPLYLWHWPLLSFVRHAEGALPLAEMRIAAVAIAIPLAWLTYCLIERPIRFGRHRSQKAIGLLALMLATACAAYTLFRLDGLTSRFPKILTELMNYSRPEAVALGKGACFLAPSQDYSAFKHCAWPAENGGRPSLLLWGDSNAEHLYAGYISSVGGQFDIFARTASLCPPILGMEITTRPHCKKINDCIDPEKSCSSVNL